MIESFRRDICAKRIQRVFRAFLLYQNLKKQREHASIKRKQRKLQKVLAGKVIVKAVKKWLWQKHRVEAARVIQAGYRKVKF